MKRPFSNIDEIIIYDDYKELNIDGLRVGLSQASCKSKQEFENIKTFKGQMKNLGF